MQLTAFLGILMPLCALAAKSLNGGEKAPYYVDRRFWRAIVNDICQLPSLPRPTGSPNIYLECIRPIDDDEIRSDIGVWSLQKCLNGYEFMPLESRCRPRSTVRRQQQQLCSRNPSLCSGNSPIQVRQAVAPAQSCGCPTSSTSGCMCPGPQVYQPAVVPQPGQPTPLPLPQPQPQPYIPPQPQPQPYIPPQPIQPQPQPYIPPQPVQPVPQPTPAPPVQPVQPPAPQPQPVPQPVVQPAVQQPCGCQQQTTCPCAPQWTIQINICPCPTQQTVCQPCTVAPQPLPPTIAPQPIPQPLPQPTPAPQPQIQPQPCPQAQGTGTQGAQENGICSWMLAPLAAHPSDQKSFLQCQPAPWNVFCGRWRRMPCSPYTIFDVNVQVCVNDPNAPVGPLGPAQPVTQPPIITQPPYIPPQPQPVIPQPQPQQPQQQCGCSVGIQIGQCGSNYQCPGMSVCQVQQQPQQQTSCGACCYFGMKFVR